VEAVKRTATQPSGDRAVTDAESLQLPAGDEAELAPRDPRDCVIVWVLPAAAGAQNVTEFSGQDEPGSVSTLRDGLSPRSTGAVDVGQF
jgi:hypothetical protein